MYISLRGTTTGPPVNDVRPGVEGGVGSSAARPRTPWPGGSGGHRAGHGQSPDGHLLGVGGGNSSAVHHRRHRPGAAGLRIHRRDLPGHQRVRADRRRLVGGPLRPSQVGRVRGLRAFRRLPVRPSGRFRVLGDHVGRCCRPTRKGAPHGTAGLPDRDSVGAGAPRPQFRCSPCDGHHRGPHRAVVGVRRLGRIPGRPGRLPNHLRLLIRLRCHGPGRARFGRAGPPTQ